MKDSYMPVTRGDDGSHISSYHPNALAVGEALSTRVLSYFDSVKEERGMPWRVHVEKDEWKEWSKEQKGQRAYEVWISEIMLQQTQVSTVIPYYSRWMEAFPTLVKLAKSDIETVNGLWKGLGYYSRASRLLSAAQKVVEQFDGILPMDPKILEKQIDGIGPYSAGAICSIAYKQNVPMVDGNIARVLCRLFGLYAPPTAASTTKELYRIAEELVRNSERPGDWNQALMEIGATICVPCNNSQTSTNKSTTKKTRGKGANTSSGPKCSDCPLASECIAFKEEQSLQEKSINFDTNKTEVSSKKRKWESTDIEDLCQICVNFDEGQKGGVHSYPMKVSKKKKRIEQTKVCVLEYRTEDHGSHFLMTKRKNKGLLAGLWEFPSIVTETQKKSSTSVPFTKSALSNLLRGLIAPSSFKVLLGQLESVDRFALTSVNHEFSHISMTYTPERIIFNVTDVTTLTSNHLPDLLQTVDGTSNVKWVPEKEVSRMNIGVAMSKIWAEIQQDHSKIPKKKRKV